MTMVRYAASCGFAHCGCSLALATPRPSITADAPVGATHGASVGRS
jgi:hypothetical protein